MSANIKLSETQFCIRILMSRQIYVLKMWFSKFPIDIYLKNLSTYILKYNGIIMRWAMPQNTRWEMMQEGMLDWHCALNELAKHPHPLNNTSDKLCNIVTGNLLRSKSILQIQFNGKQMKAQCISNLTEKFHKTIWNLVKSFEVMLLDRCDKCSWSPCFKLNPMPPNERLICEYGCLCKGSKSPLVHKLGVVQQWSTLPHMLKSMHNSYSTSWYCQLENFNLSSCPNEGKARTLHRSLWNFDIGHVRRMFCQESWENASSGSGNHWLQHQPTVVTASLSGYNENKINETFQHLYRVPAWMNKLRSNSLFLTSWSKHHNTVICSISYIREA